MRTTSSILQNIDILSAILISPFISSIPNDVYILWCKPSYPPIFSLINLLCNHITCHFHCLSNFHTRPSLVHKYDKQITNHRLNNLYALPFIAYSMQDHFHTIISQLFSTLLACIWMFDAIDLVGFSVVSSCITVCWIIFYIFIITVNDSLLIFKH